MLKLLAFLAGCAGVAGFFMPLAEYHDAGGKISQSVSPYEIVTMESDPDAIYEFAKGLGATHEQALQISETAQNSLIAYQGTIVAFYIPAALQALFGFINLLRGRMGRFAGFMAMLCGAANAAVFVFFYRGGQADPHGSLGWGVWLLAAAGAGGVIAGLLTLFAPDND